MVNIFKKFVGFVKKVKDQKKKAKEDKKARKMAQSGQKDQGTQCAEAVTIPQEAIPASTGPASIRPPMAATPPAATITMPTAWDLARQQEINENVEAARRLVAEATRSLEISRAVFKEAEAAKASAQYEARKVTEKAQDDAKSTTAEAVVEAKAIIDAAHHRADKLVFHGQDVSASLILEVKEETKAKKLEIDNLLASIFSREQALLEKERAFELITENARLEAAAEVRRNKGKGEITRFGFDRTILKNASQADIMRDAGKKKGPWFYDCDFLELERRFLELSDGT
ncbi:hypothetical protein EDC01DRAFT_783787 [Geopyxis carbonaria]|nr:hypothetical protein EDC01DRAFT_783787 [Geopyxis carbonaria]